MSLKKKTDTAGFDKEDLLAIWGPRPVCLLTCDRNIDWHHCLGRGQSFGVKIGNESRRLFGSVYNAVPICRPVHDGPMRDALEMRYLFLRLIDRKIQEAINFGKYEVKERDFGFLEILADWKAKNIPCWS